MTRLLLDTNVLSEIGKPAPEPRVTAFLRKQAEVFVSVISLHEIEYGIALLPVGRRRAELETAMAAVVSAFGNNVLAVGEREAKLAASLRADVRKRGRVLHLPDALIAATAKENGLTLATRNVSDFDYLGVAIIDPWALVD
ncbi:MAG: type II toxin-antitoxin system VapC family toxin [Rhodomicrobium sp.]